MAGFIVSVFLGSFCCVVQLMNFFKYFFCVRFSQFPNDHYVSTELAFVSRISGRKHIKNGVLYAGAPAVRGVPEGMDVENLSVYDLEKLCAVESATPFGGK